MHKQKLREIQLLLYRRAGSSNKEVRRILDDMLPCATTESLLSVFELLFGVSKYSNREMLYFLDVFLKYAAETSVLNGIGDRVANLRFTPSEKDTDSVILRYFGVVNAVIDSISEDAAKSVFSRYTYILCNSVVSKAVFPEIFREFKVFLARKETFLRMFVGRGMYRDIACSEDFVVDFCDAFSDEEIVDAAFEFESLRGFAVNHTGGRYLFQTFYPMLPAWYMTGLHDCLLPYLFYAFDAVGVYKDVSACLHRELDAEWLLKTIDEDLEPGADKCDLDHGAEALIDLQKDVETFNETGSPEHMFERHGRQLALELLRYSEDTDLKQLGKILCKLSSEEDLKAFADTFDFVDMDVLHGLRTFLLSFHLLGEGQIIHRVVEIYAGKYYRDNAGTCTFMEISEDEKTREFIFNLSFSFLVLNTKLYNANIKAKPSFRDYMKDFSADEIPGSFTDEYLESMFLSVKKSPLEFPTRNKPGREHYKVHKRICQRLGGDELLMLPPGGAICHSCRLDAHRRLFLTNYSHLLSLDPEMFYLLCSKLDAVHPFEEYLMQSRGDVSRFLEAFVYYFRMKGRMELYVVLFGILLKTERRRGVGMFSDLGSFLKSSGSRERILPQYKGVYDELVEAEILDVDLVCNALREYAGSDGAQDRIGFVNSVVIDILERNVDKARDLSMLDEEGVAALLERCVSAGNQQKFCEMSRFMSHEGLLRLFTRILAENAAFVDSEVLDVFKRIPVYNDDGFRSVLLLQSSGIDMFDSVVTVQEESIACRAINAKEDGGERDEQKLEFSEKDMLSCYSIAEKYEDILADPSNLFHFYASSGSIVNQSRARSIHKSGCPMEQALFSAENIDRRLIYMIKKADALNSKDITNYALWIINLLSSSLPLLAKFFVRNFGLLLTLKDQAIVSSFVKIFYSRLCKAVNGSGLCCGCGYSSLDDADEFIDLLLRYDLAAREDFEYYFRSRERRAGGGDSPGKDGEPNRDAELIERMESVCLDDVESASNSDFHL